jgi:hypothetical protein
VIPAPKVNARNVIRIFMECFFGWANTAKARLRLSADAIERDSSSSRCYPRDWRKS